MKLRFLFILLALTGWLRAQDTIVRTEGPPQVGKIIGADAQGVRVEVIVIVGQPPASIVIRYPQIKSVVLADAATTSQYLRTATVANLSNVAALWQQRQALLLVPGANAGEIGLAYGRLLLETHNPAQAQAALDLFQKIESIDLDEDHKSNAAVGRLQALIALGRAEEAVADAKKLAESAEDPSTLIQAKFILAEAAFKELQKLVEDNPRWTEDVTIRPVRNELYHRTLDLYLYAYLFNGAETEPAARGLWGAIQVYRSAADLPQARELAHDLEVLYPGTTYAAQAKTFVQTLSPELQKQDYEKPAN